MNPQWIELALIVAAYVAGRIEQFARDARAAMNRKK
jgi:hypothetical protein